MKTTTITTNDQYNEEIENGIIFFNEEIEGSIFEIDFNEQKEIALRDDDISGLIETIEDFIDHYNEYNIDLDEDEYINEQGYNLSISTSIAYKIIEELDL